MPSFFSLSTQEDHIRYCQKWSMISGMAIMLGLCVLGLPPVGDLSKNFQAHLGAHHQWAHGGEMLVAAAFCYPYVQFERVAWYKVLFVSMFLAMFCNGAGYFVAGMSGHWWIGSDTQGTPRGMPEVPEREFTHWSAVSLALVPALTVMGCFLAFPLFVYGLLQNVEGANLLEKKDKTT
ncbi:hypothetical protein IV203_013972 [Nitzschia inconspicua]|uniref:Uncharacterized protein n=1 Tax=Nitzschia inconspicua TaxID=303405 RepID=A0A9K3Q7V3_9STRA|nr:hypothetical protein IV203_014247 [Nitzschia inconspicua]KAG7374877.1 hypothetical protein IV203_013972 [Nitzschia inconspicua]